MRVLELFCGIGGLAAALDRNFAIVVGAFDQDPTVLSTYRYNFPEHPAVRLDLSAHEGATPVELLGRQAFPTVGPEPYTLTLAPLGFFWLSLPAAPAPAPTA